MKKAVKAKKRKQEMATFVIDRNVLQKTKLDRN